MKKNVLNFQHNISNLRTRIEALLLGNLARASILLSIGSVIGGVLGYVFQISMGRMLSVQEYGLFSAMIALFSVLTAPLGTLSLVISRRVSEYRAKLEYRAITHFYRNINISAAVVGALVFSLCIIFATQLQFYLKAPSLTPIYILGVVLFIAIPAAISNAFLQGLQKFSSLSAVSSFSVFLKVVFSVGFVWLGYKITGAMAGVMLAALVTVIITYAILRRPLSMGNSQSFYSEGHLSFKAALPVLIANVSFAAMTQLDVVLVNHYFNTHDASHYAAAAIFGKAVMYLAGGISMALFPMVAENHTRKENSVHLLLQSVGLTLLVSGAGAVFYFIFGEWMIGLLYGEDYKAAGRVLKYYGFAILPMTLVMVAEYFLIAKGRILFAYLFALIAPIQLVVIHYHHESLQMIVAVIGGSGLLLVILGFGLLWSRK